MAYSTDHVAAASPLATGGIWVAPKGTALPTDATTALNAAFKALGRVGEDGLQPSGEAASKADLRDWSGDVVASVTENRSISRFDFTLLGIFDEEVAKFVFGDGNVTVTAATASAGTKIAITDKGEDIAAKALVFDMLYEGKRMRIVAPDASTIVTAELPFVRNALSGYTCQVTCLADGSGVRTYRYYQNDDLTA